MTRTKLLDREMPGYSWKEELFNSISHYFGAALSIAALVLSVVKSTASGNVLSVIGSAIFTASLIVLYTMSGTYHAMPDSLEKRVFQVIDHCTIYLLIAGTYTPILLCSIMPISKGWVWGLFAAVWGISLIATVFTAIDLNKYRKLSMICYIVLGWCIILATKTAIQGIGLPGFIFLLAGGISYTLGAVLYNIGKKKQNGKMHCVFHVFVLIGSILHFVCIFFYVI